MNDKKTAVNDEVKKGNYSLTGEYNLHRDWNTRSLMITIAKEGLEWTCKSCRTKIIKNNLRKNGPKWEQDILLASYVLQNRSKRRGKPSVERTFKLKTRRIDLNENGKQRRALQTVSKKFVYTIEKRRISFGSQNWKTAAQRSLFSFSSLWSHWEEKKEQRTKRVEKRNRSSQLTWLQGLRQETKKCSRIAEWMI